MKILSLELRGYKRLLLSNIHYIKLTPQNKLQLILGTNGSGKSSLLKELSPLPAIPLEFSKEGSKIIEILHNNSTYLLKSIFSSTGNKFHFIKDGEELNPGGTTSVYKELVKKEFNITQDVHDLMVGSNGFHTMSVAERRNWFTKISDADYTYAISYYQKLREQLRDIQGAIKLNQSRLVQESEKLLSPEEELKYRDEINDLHKLTSMLLELKTPITNSRDNIRSQLNTYESQLAELSKQLISYRKQFLNLEAFSSTNDIDLAIINCKTKINSASLTVENLCKQIEQNQSTLEALHKANLDSFTDIDQNIDKISAESFNLTKQLRLNFSISDPKQTFQALSTVANNLVDIFIAIDENADRRFTRDTYMRTLDEQKVLSNQITQLDAQQLQFVNKKKELEHFKEHNKSECPKCSHIWFKGYDEQVYVTLLSNIERASIKLTALNQELYVKDTLLQQMKEYLELQRAYSDISKNWTILNPLWNHISDTNLFFEAPRQIPSIIDAFKTDLLLAIQIEEVNKRLKDNLELKLLISKNQETDRDKLDGSIGDLHETIYQTNKTLKNHRSYLSKLNLYREVSIKIISHQTQIENLLTNRTLKSEELIQLFKREALNETIDVVRLELNKKEHIISKINIQKALVENIDIQLKELNEKAGVLKIAVKELSPTEGLIAKGLTGFINHFIFQVNSFIKKIWSYPLELLHVDMNSEDDLDLDYKFPVLINDSIHSPDVGKTSAAMKEVIDLAFRVVSMQYLGLQEAPIYLDEFAASMDHAHRESALNAINNLVTCSNFTQIFMISHYENSYGCLKNTDITILCQNNIVIPKDTAFNKAVVIS